MSKTQSKSGDAAKPAEQAPFVPTHGGVYRVSKTGTLTTQAGGPPPEQSPAPAEQPKAGDA